MKGTLKYRLEENAVDSLRYAVEYFDMLIRDNDNLRYLKPTILFLENSVELLLKSILVLNDPLSIYESRSKQIVELAQNKVKNSGLTLAEILICELNVKTIGYGKVIETYCELYPDNQKLKEVFLKLGKYRNTITHFGINVSDKLDDLICNVYDSFEVISNELYSQLLEVDEYFEYNDFLDIVEPIIEGSQEYIRYLCINNLDRKISTFTDALKNVLNSNVFKELVKNNNIELVNQTLNFENDDFWIEVYKSSVYHMGLLSRYSSFHNATIFSEDNGMIYFVVEHETGLIYDYFKESFYADSHESEKYFQWRSDEKEGLCRVKKLTEENLFILFKDKFLADDL